MSKKKAKSDTAEFKAKGALEAIRGDLTINEISSKYGVHSTQINRWKHQGQASIKMSFTGKQEKARQADEQLIDRLYRQIGQLTCEHDFLKKKCLGLSPQEKLAMIDKEDTHLSLRQPCALLQLNRSNVYYQPVAESEENR